MRAVPVFKQPYSETILHNQKLMLCNRREKWCHALCSILPNLLISRINVSSVYRTAFSHKHLQFFYRYRIVLIAEMAVHLDGLTLIDHLLQFLLSDTDQSLLDALSGAVAGELSRDLIKNFQTEITRMCSKIISGVLPASSRDVMDVISFRRFSKVEITSSEAPGSSCKINPPAWRTVLSLFISTPKATLEGVCSEVAKS